jgi:hypothetical protein
LGPFLPYFHETNKIILVVADGVVWLKVVMFKLLDNDQDEEVEHNMRAQQN